MINSTIMTKIFHHRNPGIRTETELKPKTGNKIVIFARKKTGIEPEKINLFQTRAY